MHNLQCLKKVLWYFTVKKLNFGELKIDKTYTKSRICRIIISLNPFELCTMCTFVISQIIKKKFKVNNDKFFESYSACIFRVSIKLIVAKDKLYPNRPKFLQSVFL